ncbi:MAG TPA: hypothetical protein VJZ91_13500, partial [Blastocatellia bacterium]|nr:hypothetical protein [Blastocatellia bacterium]
MRRALGLLIMALALLATTMLALTVARTSRPEKNATRSRAIEPHQITVTPIGPDQATIDKARSDLLGNPALTPRLKGTRARILAFEFIESDPKANDKPVAPTQYRAQVFDYTNNRAYVVIGSFKDSRVQVSETQQQPNSSQEEFDDALSVIAADKQLGAAVRDHLLEPYMPMPPLAAIDMPVGKVERTVTVGLMPPSGKDGNEVVGVNLIRRTVVRYPNGAPPTSNAVTLNCGVPNAGQTTTTRGTAGQFDVVISRNGAEVWRFTCIRPSASSGTNASGIDLKNVKYNGKLVLKEAHAPILNVQYERNFCGPFRDWSYQEGMFAANGTDVAAGIRMCTEPPQTVIENGTDTGNFRGVAIYDHESVTLVSELNAGWYRYISKWVFHDDGLIEPRFAFGATANSCICHNHTHHVYWRFDFDLNTAANNAAFESQQGSLKPIETESRRARIGGSQFFIVRNLLTGETAQIRPGPLDGNFDKYGKGDLWFLLYKSTEIDDNGGSSTAINIDPYVNGENISSADLVVWYAGHWKHD